MSIFLLRHAESTFNVFDMWHREGQEPGPDCSLSDDGKKQAMLLEGKFDLILSSPLKRCKQTLDYSKLTATKVEIRHDLREVVKEVSDTLEGETFEIETDQSIRRRAKSELAYIRHLQSTNENIRLLILSHHDLLNALIQEANNSNDDPKDEIILLNSTLYQWVVGSMNVCLI